DVRTPTEWAKENAMSLDSRHDRLVSLAVSAMLTSALFASAPGGVVAASTGPQPAAIINALTAIRAAGWSGAQNVDMPSPPTPQASATRNAAAASNRPISDAQFKKILDDNATNGGNTQTAPIVAKAFGVDHPSQSERRDVFEGPDKSCH